MISLTTLTKERLVQIQFLFSVLILYSYSVFQADI